MFQKKKKEGGIVFDALIASFIDMMLGVANCGSLKVAVRDWIWSWLAAMSFLRLELLPLFHQLKSRFCP